MLELLPNDFSDLADYLLRKAVVEACASLRGQDGLTPPDQLDLLLDLLQWNDNDLNPFSDHDYLACVIGALRCTKLGAVATFSHSCMSGISRARRLAH